ncbi:hypothetical protein [Nonomuraea sp. NPDC050783]|uniref:hypothetical protein n=1 Tax=Nonomuraea sp. NPDC050783 TaxID=3154634 RepID=UPI0034657371
MVYDLLPGATIDPPAPGLGTPSKFYVLSNNHVLADSNRAPVGSPIVQPGTFDGGVDPQDRISTLSRFIPLDLTPAVPLANHNNLVDAAIGEVQFQDATRECYFIDGPRGWRRKANVSVGDLVKKVGRTTNLTTGRIIAVDATRKGQGGCADAVTVVGEQQDPLSWRGTYGFDGTASSFRHTTIFHTWSLSP